MDGAIDANADIAEAILEFGLQAFGIDPDDDTWKGQTTPNDMEKARSTIKQLYRDWSLEGSPERHDSNTKILLALEEHLPPVQASKRYGHHVLLPGAGLGRLVFDICAAGYSVQGNEISYHQILASNYILNGTQQVEQHKLYPWVLNFSNHLTRANQLRSVLVPDVSPAAELEASQSNLQSELHYSNRLSMTSGDFSVLYRQPEYKERFNAVVTCFFIDTAPNVINYIETIKNCLTPGGIWINTGPLLWHFESSPTPAERDKRPQADSGEHSRPRSTQRSSHTDSHDCPESTEGIGEPGSFELSNDEVLSLVQRFGFEVLEVDQAPTSGIGYVGDPRSMLRSVYHPVFWVARKT